MKFVVFGLTVLGAAMVRMGHCPSGRLFEAAACAIPVISDEWEGRDQFFGGRDIAGKRSLRRGRALQ